MSQYFERHGLYMRLKNEWHSPVQSTDMPRISTGHLDASSSKYLSISASVHGTLDVVGAAGETGTAAFSAMLLDECVPAQGGSVLHARVDAGRNAPAQRAERARVPSGEWHATSRATTPLSPQLAEQSPHALARQLKDLHVTGLLQDLVVTGIAPEQSDRSPLTPPMPPQ